MKKIKSIIAALLAAMMAMTLVGCDEEGTASSGGAANPASIPGAANPDPDEDEDDESFDPVKVDMSDSATAAAAAATADQLAYPDLKVEKRLKWMAWYTIDETSPAAELFKEAYGIPENGDDPEAAGQIFEFNKVTWKKRFDGLSAAISSDTSPDLFPFDDTDFPYGVLMGRYQPLDDIIDVNNVRWSGAKEIMDQYVIKGKHYCAFTDISIDELFWYRKSNIDAIGADDPQELFKAGKWDWNSFLKIARAWKASGSEESPKYVIDGWNLAAPFVATTGVPQVGMSDGKLVNNYYTADFERAMDKIVLVMHDEEMRYPYETLNNWSVSTDAWRNAQTLFFVTGSWDYEGVFQGYGKDDNWPKDEIKVVPAPKDPSTDKYYLKVRQSSYMWVKGSSNKEGVQAWFDCNAVVAHDPAVAEANTEKLINNEKTGWTRELLDFINGMYKLDGSSPFTFVVEHKNGLGPTVLGAGNTEDPCNVITMVPFVTGQLEGEPVTYVQLRDQFKGIIDAAIDEINNKLS